MSTKRQWRKILYEDQNVPDNYVDDSFLEEMKKNLNTRTYDYWTVAYESGSIVQQISSVILYILVFIHMDSGAITPYPVMYVALCAAIIGYLLFNVIAPDEARSRKEDFRTLVIYLGFAYGLSPVLMTLTESISTDTIYAATTALMLVNLLFHDYTTNDSTAVPGAVSLNAAIFASVCLASRLASHLHAFTTVTLAVLTFALWPALRAKVKRHLRGGHLTLTFLLSVSSTGLLYALQPILACLAVLLYLFITLLCPAWLVGLQPYKNAIHGPWDEAEIKD